MSDLIDMALSLGLAHLWQSVLWLGLALLVMRWRMLGAELRSWLLLAIFFLAAASPLAIFLPSSAAPAATLMSTEPAGLSHLAAQPEAWVPAVDTAAGSNIGFALPAWLSGALALLWLLGTCRQLLALGSGWRRGFLLRRAAQPAPELGALLAGSLPRHASVAVTEHDGPLVMGLRQPIIIVPRSLAKALEPAALRDVLLHEVAHIRRGDLWAAQLQRLLCALFWWSPLLHLIGARLELAREVACDARAARFSGAPVDYADALLASVEHLQRLAFSALKPAPTMPALGMFAAQQALDDRVNALLEDAPPASVGFARLARALAVSLLLLALGAAAMVTPRLTLKTQIAQALPPGQTAALAELIDAVRAADIERVQLLVAGGVDVNARLGERGTPLMQAAWAGDPAITEALLKLGADPNKTIAGEGSALIIAAAMGYLSVAERLVAAGADVNRAVMHASSPLIDAAQFGHLETVQFLVEAGADVNLGVGEGSPEQWLSPLNQASDPAVRAFLISRGAVASRPPRPPRT